MTREFGYHFVQLFDFASQIRDLFFFCLIVWLSFKLVLKGMQGVEILVVRLVFLHQIVDSCAYKVDIR